MKTFAAHRKPSNTNGFRTFEKRDANFLIILYVRQMPRLPSDSLGDFYLDWEASYDMD